VTHHARHYQVLDVTMLPRPLQRPRVPVWIGGFWPHRRPMRRAARWDGAVPLFLSARHGHPPPVDEVRELVEYVRGHRDSDPGRPFELVLGGASPTNPADARALLGPLIEAGATWWDERRPIDDEVDRLEPVLRRTELGPPTL
jgi:alkanesulfonate monooxygenase SsuD/methylene tetrahydromethanopterin reductase-like flavin-dependent oxidoreductase (luciferase family)